MYKITKLVLIILTPIIITSCTAIDGLFTPSGYEIIIKDPYMEILTIRIYKWYGLSYEDYGLNWVDNGDDLYGWYIYHREKTKGELIPFGQY